MQLPLPYGGYKWVNPEGFDIYQQNVPNVGFILECDLEVPKEYHDKYSDYPFLPTKENVDGQVKLLMTLWDKEKYPILIDNLKLALKHGIRLKKIHRILSFQQKPFLKPYIELNTKLRSEATTEFRKNLFKLMNNIIFGRSIMNKRKYMLE